MPGEVIEKPALETVAAGFSADDRQAASDCLAAYSLFGRKFDAGPTAVQSIVDTHLADPRLTEKAVDFSILVGRLENFGSRPILEVMPGNSADEADDDSAPQANFSRYAISQNLLDGYRRFEEGFGLFSKGVNAVGLGLSYERDDLRARVMELCEMVAPGKWGEISIVPLGEWVPPSVFTIDPPSRAYLKALLRQQHIAPMLYEDPLVKAEVEDPEQVRSTLGEEALAVGNLLLNARAHVSPGQITEHTGLTSRAVRRVFAGRLGELLSESEVLELSTVTDAASLEDRYRIVPVRRVQARKEPSAEPGAKARAPQRTIEWGKPKTTTLAEAQEAAAAKKAAAAEKKALLLGCYRDFFNNVLAHCNPDGVHEGENLGQQYRQELNWSKHQWGNYRTRLRVLGYISSEVSERYIVGITGITLHGDKIDAAITAGKLLPLSLEHPTVAETLAAKHISDATEANPTIESAESLEPTELTKPTEKGTLTVSDVLRWLET